MFTSLAVARKDRCAFQMDEQRGFTLLAPSARLPVGFYVDNTPFRFVTAGMFERYKVSYLPLERCEQEVKCRLPLCGLPPRRGIVLLLEKRKRVVFLRRRLVCLHRR